MLDQFLDNFLHNLFKPLLLFFYAGFLVPILGVKLEFPKAVYQGLTIYLLLAIGWHGGEELASLKPTELSHALGFMVLGFCTNFIIGIVAYKFLRMGTGLRQVDAATVAGFYGSDSAGTFATAVGVLVAGNIAYAAYMPVMLAVMEIPGCLVALYLVSKCRRDGMDALGNMPFEPGYDPNAKAIVRADDDHGHGHGGGSKLHASQTTGNGDSPDSQEAFLALEKEQGLPDQEVAAAVAAESKGGWLNKELLHEVFLNPGIFLLFAGILIGFVGRLQGEKVTKVDDTLFLDVFHGMLCIFLLEMGMTASSKIKDLRAAGLPFIAFAIIAPNIFATFGMFVAHGYSMAIGQPFEIGTYLLFAVLCGAASYIAVPAVQRMAIPEASPTLPLAASLACTFSYNVTIGIPVYILIAELITKAMPVVGSTMPVIEKAVSGGH